MLNISLELILSARKGEKLGGMKNDGNEEEWRRERGWWSKHGGITAVVDHKAAVENGIKSDKRRSHGRI